MLCRGRDFGGGRAALCAGHRATRFPARLCRAAEATLKRLAAVYICSPSNPEGAVASESYWRNLFALADKYDFIVLADECYADIYFGAAAGLRPAGAAGTVGGFARLLSFHSLSKRSGLPGLRSGMVAGDAGLIAKFRAFRNVAGPQVPGPILAASAAAWRDEDHVAAPAPSMPKRWRRRKRILGDRMQRPDGRLFPLAEDGQWRRDRPRPVGRAGGPGAARRLHGARK